MTINYPPRTGKKRANTKSPAPTIHTALQLEEVAISQLHPHPRNYRGHPDDEIAHLMESIKSNGLYRNIVIAKDGTILAGHGVVKAAHRLGIESIPVYRTEYDADDPRALKLLVSDNEISHLVDSDDRMLTEILKELKETDIDLFGTGYDDMMLANLLFVSRPAAEIADLDAAAQWVGMPGYDLGEGRIQIIVNFATEEDRKEFCHLLNLDINKIGTKGVEKSIWWPMRGDSDNTSIRFVSQEGEDD
jgi:hypothetical protein